MTMQIYRQIHKSTKGYHAVHHQGNNLFSNTGCNTLLPKSYFLPVITKLWKKSNQQKPLLWLPPLKKIPLRKIVTKKTPAGLHCLSQNDKEI